LTVRNCAQKKKKKC